MRIIPDARAGKVPGFLKNLKKNKSTMKKLILHKMDGTPVRKKNMIFEFEKIPAHLPDGYTAKEREIIQKEEWDKMWRKDEDSALRYALENKPLILNGEKIWLIKNALEKETERPIHVAAKVGLTGAEVVDISRFLDKIPEIKSLEQGETAPVGSLEPDGTGFYVAYLKKSDVEEWAKEYLPGRHALRLAMGLLNSLEGNMWESALIQIGQLFNEKKPTNTMYAHMPKTGGRLMYFKGDENFLNFIRENLPDAD